MTANHFQEAVVMEWDGTYANVFFTQNNGHVEMIYMDGMAMTAQSVGSDYFWNTLEARVIAPVNQ